MGLNETLDRLAKEREARETTDNARLTEEVRDCLLLHPRQTDKEVAK